MSKSIKLKNDTYIDSTGVVVKDNYGDIKTIDRYLNLSNIVKDLPANADLNNYTNYGWYKWDANITPTNAPLSGCTMLVIPHMWGCMQFCTYYSKNNMNIYFRKKCNWEDWSNWCKLNISSI